MEYVKETVIKASPERVFAFHQLPDAFERLVPPWEKVKIVQKADISKLGSRTILETRIMGLFKVQWVAEHTAYDPPRMFEDTQVSGPFRKWRHRHIVKLHPEGAVLRDEIDYEMPIPIFGPLAAPAAVKPRLDKMFTYRHEVTKAWCESEN